jgi:hypothetical protein
VIFSESVKMNDPGTTGVWQEATVFLEPSVVAETSTLQTLQDPKGFRLGASHKVGMKFCSVCLRTNERIVSPSLRVNALSLI